ncbi:hypothetical protein [Stieleria tagensis]|uniref:hypothetical protein n=1 Tax=Stieleria tagensis TaxID=2956795 RepID=UPI00209B1F7F|nr:hypothetical protein [Stieleria tagensis]
MSPTQNRFAETGLWTVALICFVPAVCLGVFFASTLVPQAIDRRTGYFALGLGWLFWSFTVALTTSRDRFDPQIFLLVLLFFPIMYPACVLFLLPVLAMRKNFTTGVNYVSRDYDNRDSTSNSG